MYGGYIILDGKGLDLTTGSTAVTIDGIWDRAEKVLAADKPIIAKNLRYGNAKVSPVPCFGWYLAEDEIVLVSATIHVHITDDDEVTTLDVAGD